MSNLKRLALFLVVLGAVSACSNSQQTFSAPTSQEEAGVIISGSQAQAQSILENSESYRVISVKHNVYEVKGLSIQKIKELAPNLKVDQNIYMDNVIERSENPKASFLAKLANGESPKANIQQVPPVLEGCDLEAKEVPFTEMVPTMSPLTQSATMNLGEVLGLAATPSLSHLADGELEFRWELMPPAGSKLQGLMLNGVEADFTPDTVGMYQVGLVAKASDNSCGVQMIRFLVTHNPEILRATVDEEKPELEIELFTHLAKTNIPLAWEQATGKGVKIAVLDTGLHYNHPGIKFNLAFNEDENMGDMDSDENGFPGDVLGWDFVNGDNLPFDDEGHGSHVGGLTSSHIFGAAKNSTILPIKVLNAAGGGDVGSVVAGIYYAVDNGAQVINGSLQRLDNPNDILLEAIEYALEHNVVFISAAGNDTLDLSMPGNQIYPGEIDAANVVNVAATGFDNGLTDYSNFGFNQTDVAAPGGDGQDPIYSLATINAHAVPFVPSGGTSMAAPIVAGVAAMMIEANPNITAEEIRTVLMNSGEKIDRLSNVVGSGRLLDAKEAVEGAKALSTGQPLS